MIRYFLARGDRAGCAVITEGLDSVTCSNPPPRVQIATLYMKTYCTACERAGHIAPTGLRWPGTGPNGQPWALSGDINICGCNPPPAFYAERGMSMTFTSEQVARLDDRGNSGNSSSHWIKFKLAEPGNCEGLRCAAHFVDGSIESGVFDACGMVSFARSSTSSCSKVEILADGQTGRPDRRQSLCSRPWLAAWHRKLRRRGRDGRRANNECPQNVRPPI